MPWFLIGLQVLLAAAALHMWRWHVLPSLRRLPQGELVLDVWGPIAIVLPLLFTVGWVEHSVRDGGWPLLGGPIVCGMFAVGLALLPRAGSTSAGLPLLRAGFAVAVASAVLLLLGAAHIMTIWIGQISFAIAAVILWINTPQSRPAAESPDASQIKAGLAMACVVLCAAAIGVVALQIEPPYRAISATLMLIVAITTLGLALWLAGAEACARLGLWAASIGVLFALGILSLKLMVPQAIASIGQLVFGMPPAQSPGARAAAYGFGAYAFEATALLVLPLLLAMTAWMPGQLRRGIGGLILLGAAALVLWRLSAVETLASTAAV